MARILVAAQMRAAGECTAPLVKNLSARGHSVFVVSAGPATSVFAEAGKSATIVFRNNDIGTAAAKVAINTVQPHAVITGANFPANGAVSVLEQSVISEAIARDIPVISVVDTWNYEAQRFSTVRNVFPFTIVSFGTYLPNLICVPDEVSFQRMLAVGIDASRMRVTGNPNYELLETNAQAALKDAASISCNVKKKFNLPLHQPLVLVLIDRIKSAYGVALGYDEHSFLESVFGVLHELSREMPVSAIVRPHPAQKGFDFTGVKNLSSETLSIGIDAAPHVEEPPSLLDELIASNAVIGMITQVLFQARVVQRPAISYQPSLAGLDIQEATNAAGITTLVTDREVLANLLPLAIKEQLIQAAPSIVRNTVDNIVRAVEELLNKSPQLIHGTFS